MKRDYLGVVDDLAAATGWVDADDDWECSMCGGEGLVECDDPIQCTRPHVGGRFDGGEICECSACHGTGLGKDQTAW